MVTNGMTLKNFSIRILGYIKNGLHSNLMVRCKSNYSLSYLLYINQRYTYLYYRLPQPFTPPGKHTRHKYFQHGNRVKWRTLTKKRIFALFKGESTYMFKP